MSKTLSFDPGQIDRFKTGLRDLPGYPAGEEIPIRAMLFETDAVFRLPELLSLAGAGPAQPLLVVMDRWPIRRGQANFKELLLDQLQQAGWPAEPLWLEPHHGQQIHADMVQIGRVTGHLRPGAAVLSVGSGVVTDIAKHACYLYQQEQGDRPVPFVACPTANSVSAFTSNTASVLVEGVKRTLPSRYPDALLYDLEMLRSAPKGATVAGVGDLLVAFGAWADWYLAAQVGLDSTYSELPQTLLGPLDELILAQAAAIRESTPAGAELLAKLLALEGLATSLARTTAPFSGFEHSISHLLDLLAEHTGRPVAQHGTQVILLTVLTTEAYRRFLAEFEPAAVNLAECYPTAAQMQARIQAAFGTIDPSGRLAAECWAAYSHKLEAWHAHRPRFEAFLSNWPAVKAELQRLARPPARLIQVLRAIDAPLHFDELTPPLPAEEIRFAFGQASFIRQRFTLGDLLIFLNWDLDRLWDQLWHTAGRLRAA